MIGGVRPHTYALLIDPVLRAAPEGMFVAGWTP
ncbi:Mycobacterium numidiamassiliense ORFan [Mycobacterium numidiamassiliense]|uniref:Mycobacterium numidiamassiliense ORFan n=1 Tax=Mycobacterium numidiamassiliense TaxID=1841861 RepID=A0A2U3PEN4_9MYCO|nr:Mycobacterium numidiamassiliense ORFan [Mycobacterium numidiamassiliense]